MRIPTTIGFASILVTLLCCTPGVTADPPPWNAGSQWDTEFPGGNAGKGKAAFGNKSTADAQVTNETWDTAIGRAESIVNAGLYWPGLSSHMVLFKRRFTLPAGGPYSVSLWGYLDGKLEVLEPHTIAKVIAIGTISPIGGDPVIRIDGAVNPKFNLSFNQTGQNETVDTRSIVVSPVTLAAGEYEVGGGLITSAVTTNGSWGDEARSLFFGEFQLYPSYEHQRDAVYISDFKDKNGPLREGVMRKYLGLLNTDGKPNVDGGGALVPLVDGTTRKGFDMNGAGISTFVRAVAALKPNGGTLIVNTHGSAGSGIVLHGKEVKGFGAGTNGCGDAPYPLTGIGAKTNVTIRMVVCSAAKKCGTCTRSVADSLKKAIEDLGGSVTAVHASENPVKVELRKGYRDANAAVPLTAAEQTKADTICGNTLLADRPFPNQYSRLQNALNAAPPGGLGPGRAIATVTYCDSQGYVVACPAALGGYPTFPETDFGCADCGYVPEPSCDLDSDGDSDADDYQIFHDAFGLLPGETEYNSDADFDGDEFIGLNDYQLWLACNMAPPLRGGKGLAATTISVLPSTLIVPLGSTFDVQLQGNLDQPVIGWGLDVQPLDGSVAHQTSQAPLISGPWQPAATGDGDGLAALTYPSPISGSNTISATVQMIASGLGETDIYPGASLGDADEGLALVTPGSFDSPIFVPAHVKVIATPASVDHCDQAVPVGVGSFGFSNVGADTDGRALPPTCDEGFGLNFGADIWFRFDPPCTGLLTVTTCNAASFDTRMALYIGTCSNLTLLGCNDDSLGCDLTSRVVASVTHGQSVLIRLGGWNGAQGSGTLIVAMECEVPCPGDIAPPGGNTAVGVDDLLSVINHWGACPPPCPPGCAGDIAPWPGGNCAVNVDDLLAVINGWGPCPIDARACCLANGSCQQLTQASCASAGGGWQEQEFTCADVVCVLPPFNNECNGAAAITNGVTNFSNAGATTSAQPGGNCIVGGASYFTRDVWFSYTANCSGHVTIDLCSTTGAADPVVAAYTGSCGVLTQVGCDDNGCGSGDLRSRMIFPSTPGMQYRIRVGSNGSSVAGPMTMSVSCGP